MSIIRNRLLGTLLTSQSDLVHYIGVSRTDTFEQVYVKRGVGDQDDSVTIIHDRCMWNTMQADTYSQYDFAPWAQAEAFSYEDDWDDYLYVQPNGLVLRSFEDDLDDLLNDEDAKACAEEMRDKIERRAAAQKVTSNEPSYWPFPVQHLMTFGEAIDKAREQSEAEDCTKHVNAVVMRPSIIYSGVDPHISHYIISDWYDSATVVSFTSGREH